MPISVIFQTGIKQFTISLVNTAFIIRFHLSELIFKRLYER